MKVTEEAGHFITKALKPPHDFEYDKVFDQFIIFSKKRYVGNKYEESSTEFKQTSMGIVLKRRDNAPVLKTIYGGAIKALLNERDVTKAAKFVSDKTVEMVQGKMSLSQLTITKSLSAKYKPDYIKGDIRDLEEQIQKKRTEIEKLESKARAAALLTDREAKQKQVMETNLQALYTRVAAKRDDRTRFTYPAHKILADRMAKRDAGNAPASGERMGFVYIAPPPGQLSPKLQGDRIETPDYIREKKLQPDFKYYIEHQLMKPIGQLFGLVVEQIPGYTPSTRSLTDGDKEGIAIDLLFRRALLECDKQAQRTFFQNQFGGVQPAPRAEHATQQTFGGNQLVMPAVAQRHSERIATKVQTTLSQYMIHKEMIQQYEKKKASVKEEMKADGTQKKDKKKK
jgi:hypothetical protein